METTAHPPGDIALDSSRRSADPPSSEAAAAARHALLLVEDDAAFSRELADLLAMHQGLAVRVAADGRTALAMVDEGPLDLILIDIGLPDMDGRDLCRLIRRRGVKLPILMLTAYAGDADHILGLESGANGYLVKPIRTALLLAHIRAQLRQHELSDDATFTIGPYRFRPATKLLVDPTRQRKVHLTEREAAIVKFLYRMGDRPVPRATLLDEVWGYNARVETHTLETHIYRLRQKMEPTPRRPTLLLTEDGGYRLKR